MFRSAYPARAPSNSQCSLRSWVRETSEQASNVGCYRYNSGTLTAVMLGFKGVERDPCAKLFAECPRLRRSCGPLGGSAFSRIRNDRGDQSVAALCDQGK